jgi:hypothetical protein
MQIPSVSNFVRSNVNYFLGSSWKGKTVQVLCVGSFFVLMYLLFQNKTPPKGPENPTPLTGRVDGKPSGEKPINDSSTKGPDKAQTQPQVVSKELPKEDRSYMKRTQAYLDTKDIVLLVSEFDTWLSHKLEVSEQWSPWARSGDQWQEGYCRRELGSCIAELNERIKIMVPVFEVSGVKYSDAFLKKCNEAIIVQDTNLLAFGKQIIEFLGALRSWNNALQNLQEKPSIEIHKLARIHSSITHYEFTNLQTQYFYYLGLHTKEDFSRLLQAKIDTLEAFGLSNMEDIDCLQLRNMQPLIERLRHLVCLSEISEVTARPLIEKEIEKCREVLKRSDGSSFYGNYGKELEETVNTLNKWFDELSRKNCRNGLGILDAIEQEDIKRQLILLKGYINQSGQRQKWTQLNKTGIVSLAAAYAQSK